MCSTVFVIIFHGLRTCRTCSRDVLRLILLVGVSQSSATESAALKRTVHVGYIGAAAAAAAAPCIRTSLSHCHRDVNSSFLLSSTSSSRHTT